MKKLLVLSLLALSVNSFALNVDPHNSGDSPGTICLKMDPNSIVNSVGSLNMQISNPGYPGLWTSNLVANGRIINSGYVCLSPYKWQAENLYKMFGEYNSVGNASVNYAPCTGIFSTKNHSADASKYTYHYVMLLTGLHNVKCSFVDRTFNF